MSNPLLSSKQSVLAASYLLLSLILPVQAAPAPNPYVHELKATGELRFELNDAIQHPHFWWPRTLLNYRVRFDAKTIRPKDWRLIDAATGQPVPFQLSELNPDAGSATVSFFSDLPSGGQRTFLLRANDSTLPAITPDKSVHPSVQIREEAGTLLLDTGALQARLPLSQEIKAGEEAPGPLLALNDGKGWAGRSRIVSPRKAVQKIDTELLDRGPLFARARVTYTFAGNATYTVTIKATQGYNFVEVLEQMEGLPKEDGASFEMAWTDLPLTHRRGGEPIDKPHTLYFRGEDPHFIGPDGVENPAKEFYFRLGHVAADNTINITAADFTNQPDGRAVGIAVLDGAKWNDREYAIWAANETLAVRFRYTDSVLHWQLPLASGSRETAIAAYDDRSAGLKLGDSFKNWQRTSSEAAKANTGVAPGKSWISFINSRYGGMSLDVVKDWQLSYPENAKQPAAIPLPSEGDKAMKNVDAYLKEFWGDTELIKPEANWLSPVSMRIMSKWVVPGYNKWRAQMKPEERRRVAALILFHAYFSAREEISPVRHLLKGHPNFMTDWKYPLMAGAFLFPEHPMACEWADQFEKTLELMCVFYVRPPVESWQAKGGRWTENIGVYNWAFLQPAIYANELGLLYDGRDRWPNPGIALHGQYIGRIVTAPVKMGVNGEPFNFQPGTELTRQNGFQRIHPPQGAHGGRRPIPAVAENFGLSLLRYRPLVGEHLLWISQRPPGSAGGIHGEEGSHLPPQTNFGTNPRLTSEKYTGYGIVMRAAVDTPQEISVFLQQIDKGPNYRWGFGNEGGCGDIYYYAAGKSFAGHLGEDAGDRRVTDAELTSNTGVYKDHTFRGIGMNELTEPFYNLESAQFAELLPRQGADAYSWPEYTSRAVLLVGHDYIITFDVVNGMSRLSWNTIKGQDEMPNVIPIRGETAFRTTQTSVSPRLGTSESVRFEPYKSGGDRMALVSHRKDVTVARPHKDDPEGITVVRTPESTDTLFIHRDAFTSSGESLLFTGRVGVIRQPRTKSAATELVLFHGSRIGIANQIQLTVDNPNLGLSASFKQPEESAGVFFSREGGTLTLTLANADSLVNARFYVDGAELAGKRDGGKLTLTLPPGEHRWQLTAGAVEPMPPQIVHSETQANGARLVISPVASAQSYRIEQSEDNGLTWKRVGETATQEFTLTGIQAPAKIHVRAVALNRSAASRPGRDYPVYVTGKAPEPPSGLKLTLGKDQVKATWGELLGVKAYLLHRREKGQTKWTTVYRGSETSFSDSIQGMLPAYSEPGLESDAARFPSPAPVIHEYAVSALDGVGEGPLSNLSNTDPASWLNWQPATSLVFKRQSAYWLPPFVLPRQVPPPYYPK